ncbi:MAG TPA: RagB/SusD family nutrient uptake outer membrane protein, partial [Prolixibacteraceae bacterium]|nr:RagB/SusD family nutrient uptake outer membrane protein [Prolixibacteraceae bacterium]
GIPYITEYISTYEGNQIAPSRDEVENNRDSIMADISAGLSLLQEDFNDASKQFITTHAAQALKARVALYFEDWETAKNAALNVVNSDSFQVATVSEYFNTWANDAAVNSIFELAFSTTDNLDFNSLSNIYRGSDYGDIEVLDNLLTIFDEDDIRIDSRMIGYEKIEEKELLRNLGKYPSANYSDNVSLIRYEEVILTLAEAKLELGENDALQYLNLIPAQRNAMPYKKATKENILKERRREFCFEGFRFDDLARTGQDIPLVSLKQTHGGPEYGSYKFAFPIPVAELNANPKMEQNSGY